MFENLSDRLERSFKILKGEGKITEINVAETLKDVRRALLDADVNFKVAKQFTDTVKQKAMGMNVLTAVKPSQLMVKIVHDELTELMGGKAVELKLENRPAIILMSGLQGLDLIHHLLINSQTTCSIDDDDVKILLLGLADGVLGNLYNVLVAFLRINLHTNTFANNLQLLDSSRTINVTSYQ